MKHVAHTQSQRQTSHDQKPLDTVQHGFMIKARWKIRRNMETRQHNKDACQHLVNAILNGKSDSIAYKNRNETRVFSHPTFIQIQAYTR